MPMLPFDTENLIADIKNALEVQMLGSSFSYGLTVFPTEDPDRVIVDGSLNIHDLAVSLMTAAGRRAFEQSIPDRAKVSPKLLGGTFFTSNPFEDPVD